MKTPTKYRPTQILLHWTIALLILALFIFENDMGRALRNVLNGGTISYSVGVGFHVFGGLSIIALVSWRLLLRLVVGVPASPEGDPPMQVLAAHIVHWGLYATLFLMPILGAIAWYGEIPFFGDLHSFMTGVFQFLVAAHIAGAAWHHYVLKDGLIYRMWFRDQSAAKAKAALNIED